MSQREAFKIGFIKSLPVLCSYLFLGIAYGLLMEEAGLHWYWSAITSLTVFTGAFQFLLISFISSGASLATIAIAALLLNSRQTFYALTYVNDFNQMGRRKFPMIHTLTDETYAINGTLDYPARDKQNIMFSLAILDYFYWAATGAIGGMLGQIIPFDMTGIDFCMTALFVIIFIDHWEKADRHFPALTGLGAAVLCLVIFGADRFMLPALLITSACLLYDRYRLDKKKTGKETAA